MASFPGDHLSCNALSRANSYTSFSHHSPQLVKKILSGSSGKSSLVKAARMDWAPCPHDQHMNHNRWRITLPVSTDFASFNISSVGVNVVLRANPVSGIRPILKSATECSQRFAAEKRTRRDSNNTTVSLQLSPPPLRAQQLNEFTRWVQIHEPPSAPNLHDVI